VTKSVFLYLSTSERFKNFLTRFKSFNNVTRRFVAGENLTDAVEAIRKLNRQGISASFDHLGESITSEKETQAEVDEYVHVLDSIHETGLDSNVSVKLTQLGLDVSQELCYANTRKIVEAARRYQNFVRIDMEDSSRTDATIQLFKRLRAEFDNVGIVIQSYLYRSEKDIEDLLKLNARIRLCKGAYKEPPSVAFPDKSDVDANYVKLTGLLLSSGIYHGLATHDQNMISSAILYPGALAKDGLRRRLLDDAERHGCGSQAAHRHGRDGAPCRGVQDLATGAGVGLGPGAIAAGLTAHVPVCRVSMSSRSTW
jgi:proline dehydrogenase